jgi:hypothetical protein
MGAERTELIAVFMKTQKIYVNYLPLDKGCVSWPTTLLDCSQPPL